MGINKGFIKEREIISILNKQIFKNLNSDFKIKIMKVFEGNINPEDELKCSKQEGLNLEKKSDLTLEVKNKKIYISVKIGKNNSLHEESIDSFINFLKSKKKISKDNIDLIYKFHWCDGTTDNRGSFSNRQIKSEFKKKNNNQYSTYISTLRNYKKEIFTRVMLGTVNQPDYLLYFENFENKIPHFIKMSDLLQDHIAEERKEDHIGIFRLQNCNACLKGQDHGHKNHKCVEGCPKIERRTKKHRNDIQFKIIDIQSNIL